LFEDDLGEPLDLNDEVAAVPPNLRKGPTALV
jgi:hypothetical protein